MSDSENLAAVEAAKLVKQEATELFKSADMSGALAKYDAALDALAKVSLGDKDSDDEDSDDEADQTGT